MEKIESIDNSINIQDNSRSLIFNQAERSIENQSLNVKDSN